MLDQAKGKPSQLELEHRIQELERENLRLSRELEERQRTESLYRMMAANLPIGGAFLVDQDLRYLLAEGQAVHDAGFTSEDFMGKTLGEVLDKETAAQYEPMYRKVLAGESFVQEHHQHERDYVSRGIPVTDEQGKVLAALVLSYDITERKRLEDALRESEYRFRTMANGTPMIIWVTDAAGKIDFINRAYTNLFDVTLDDIQSMGWEMLIHPDDQFRYVDDFQFCLKQRRPFHSQARVYRNDGQWRWVESFGQPHFSENGDFLGIVGSSLDITDRMEAERMLSENESKFHSAFENAAIGFALVSLDGHLLDVNTAYCQLTGYSREELLQLQYFPLVHPDDLEQVMQLTGQLLAREIPYFVNENCYNRKNGRSIWVRQSVTLISNSTGHTEWMLALVEDISEQKKVEQELKESEEHFQVALKNSPMLVYTTDRELRYTWIYNPAFEFDPGDVLGKTDDELNRPEDVSELVALKRSVLESGLGKREEIQLVFQAVIYYYDVTVEPMCDEKGAVYGLTVAAIDITEKRRMERAMRENQVQLELQRKLMEQREQDGLAIARDIQDGPTQALATTMYELQVAMKAMDSRTLEIELNRIGLSISNSVQVLRDIVAELRPPRLLHSGLAQAIRVHAADFAKNYPHLEVMCEVAEDLQPLPWDARLNLFRIYQEALMNVARHAAATKAAIRLSYVEDRAVLEVEDNGKGMDVLPDRMSQAESGHYGLAAMKERTESAGGHFEISSTPGKGSLVLVMIPISKRG